MLQQAEHFIVITFSGQSLLSRSIASSIINKASITMLLNASQVVVHAIGAVKVTILCQLIDVIFFVFGVTSCVCQQGVCDPGCHIITLGALCGAAETEPPASLKNRSIVPLLLITVKLNIIVEINVHRHTTNTHVSSLLRKTELEGGYRWHPQTASEYRPSIRCSLEISGTSWGNNIPLFLC